MIARTALTFGLVYTCFNNNPGKRTEENGLVCLHATNINTGVMPRIQYKYIFQAHTDYFLSGIAGPVIFLCMLCCLDPHINGMCVF